MKLLHNSEGPIGVFTASIERKKLGPNHAYNDVVDTFPSEPFCYDPEVFTPEGLLAVFDYDTSEDEDGGHFFCRNPLCVICN